MMFLNKKTLTINSNEITLYELSALQRADYYDFLAKQEKEQAGLEGIALDAKAMRSMVESQAWLVSRSLWHNDRDREIEEVYDEVAQEWSGSALNQAVTIISELSGMSKSEESTDGEGDEPEPLEK